MKITINGSSGFVATNLRVSLSSYFKVIPISLRYNPNQTFEFDGNAIIHLAGKTHDLKKVSKQSLK